MLSNLTNNATLTPLPAWIVHRPALLLWFWLVVCLSLIGTVFSVAVITIILSSKRLRAGSGVLLLNFLFSILLQCSVGMPMVTASATGIPLGNQSTNAYCRVAMFAFYICIKSVTLTDMMIGINRFVAICFPHSYPQWIRPLPLTVMVFLPWLLPVIMAVLLLYRVGGELKSALPWGACVAQYTDTYSSFLSVFLGVFFPVGVLTVVFTHDDH
ncbi:G-protein coupled receptor 39-like [Paramacrobiotus metropolitanus]|uniref:G-protein coupled receptor 39-like n=1 Tax=Paramacrobiotus metropolitanus TaxID=2943436 RepID=UPI0024460A60|nr:G-protein coupled receptor 39-like [Paramacrobiotus metropolitanus]